MLSILHKNICLKKAGKATVNKQQVMVNEQQNYANGRGVIAYVKSQNSKWFARSEFLLFTFEFDVNTIKNLFIFWLTLSGDWFTTKSIL